MKKQAVRGRRRAAVASEMLRGIVRAHADAGAAAWDLDRLGVHADEAKIELAAAQRALRRAFAVLTGASIGGRSEADEMPSLGPVGATMAGRVYYDAGPHWSVLGGKWVGVVNLNLGPGRGLPGLAGLELRPDRARGVARALLFAADVAERDPWPEDRKRTIRFVDNRADLDAAREGRLRREVRDEPIVHPTEEEEGVPF